MKKRYTFYSLHPQKKRILLRWFFMGRREKHYEKNYTFYSLRPEKNKSSTRLVFFGTEGVRTNGDMKY